MVSTLDREEREPAVDDDGSRHRSRASTPSPAESARALRDDLREMGDAAARLAKIKWYGIALAARRRVQLFVLGIWLALAGTALTVVAVVVLVQGIAGAIDTAVGAPGWVADVVTGVLILGGMALAFGLFKVVDDRRHRKKTEAKLRGGSNGREESR